MTSLGSSTIEWIKKALLEVQEHLRVGIDRCLLRAQIGVGATAQRDGERPAAEVSHHQTSAAGSYTFRAVLRLTS